MSYIGKERVLLHIIITIHSHAKIALRFSIQYNKLWPNYKFGVNKSKNANYS